MGISKIDMSITIYFLRRKLNELITTSFLKLNLLKISIVFVGFIKIVRP